MNIFKKSQQAIVQPLKNMKQLSAKLSLMLYILTAVSVMGYIVVVNYTNTMGYEIAEMQLKINQLDKDYRDLQNMATDLQSIDRIEEISNQKLNMVTAGKIDYVGLTNKAVALNKQN